MIDLGIVTPVLTRVPRAHARWERDGSLADVAQIARAADELGYHHLTCSEHVAVPSDMAATRGATYWDPLATLGYLAAITERIHLVPSVVVLGYHHPLAIAKRYGTLDHVSRGRLVLGLGVGSLEEEFDALGVPFEDRGPRADEALLALRSALSTRESSFTGRYYEWADMIVDPCAIQDPVPLWIGGRTGRSLRRAVDRADGWCPFGLEPTEIKALLERTRSTSAWEARERPVDLVLQPTRALDPSGDPDSALATAQALIDVGATCLSLRFVHHSPDHYVEQMAAMVRLAASVSD